MNSKEEMSVAGHFHRLISRRITVNTLEIQLRPLLYHGNIQSDLSSIDGHVCVFQNARSGLSDVSPMSEMRGPVGGGEVGGTVHSVQCVSAAPAGPVTVSLE